MFYIHKQTYLEGRASGLFPAPEAFETEPDLTEWYPFTEPEMLDKELFYITSELVSEEPFELTYTPKIKTLDFVKAKLTERVTIIHAQELDKGVTLPNGIKLLTTLEDRAMVSAMQTTLSINPEMATIDFKADSGWVTLTREDGLAVYAALNAFITACDNRMLAIIDGIAGAANSAEAFDFYTEEIDKGWPSSTEEN